MSEDNTNWKDLYFSTQSAKERMEILQKQLDTVPEDSYALDCMTLWKERYEKSRKFFKKNETDDFLYHFMGLKYCSANIIAGNYLDKNRSDVLTELSAIHSDWLSENEQKSEIIKREWQHLIQLYIRSCQKDKSYGTIVFGIGELTEENLAKKIANDLKEVACKMPAIVNLQTEMKFLSEIIKNSYLNIFPKYKDLF